MSEVDTPAAPARPIPRRRPALRYVLPAVLALPLLLSALGLGLYWLLARESGTVWLLQKLPGLQIESPRGALLGEFSARRLVYTLPGGSDRVIVQGLQGQGLRVRWTSAPSLWALVQVDRLHADSLQLAFAPSTEPSKAPTSLGLPVGLAIADLTIDRVDIAALGTEPLRQLRAAIELGADGGARHRLTLRSLQWDRLSLSGTAQIGSTGGLPVQAQLAVQSEASESLPAWRGQLALQGPLADLQAQAQLQAQGQHLKAQAQLQAFADWPLAGLEAEAQDLDLSALLGSLPKTALSGEARLRAKGWSEPALLKLQLSNAAAGRWDQRRLPVQSVDVELQARPDQTQNLELKRLDALLGSRAAPAGRISGQGRLQLRGKPGAPPGPADWALDARLAGLRPALLDNRLAALRLDGTARLSGASQAPIRLAAELGGDWLSAPTAKPAPLKLNLRARLEGEQLTVEEAQLNSGTARLTLKGDAARAGSGWRAQASAAMQAFDPRMLWAGQANSAWQRSRHSLNADIQLKLQQGGAGSGWPQGQIQVQIPPSQLAGVPLSGRIDYGGKPDSDVGVQARLDLGENHLQLQAELPNSRSLATINGRVDLQATKLAALDPLLGLLQPGLTLGGAAQGKASVNWARVSSGSSGGKGRPGEWKADSEGQLTLRNLHVGGTTSLDLAQGQLRWKASTSLDAPLALSAELQRLSAAGQQAASVTLDLQGSWAEHRLKAALQGQILTSAAKDAQPIAAQGQLALAGKLASAPVHTWLNGGELDWRGTITQLQLRPANSRQPVWFNADNLVLLAQANAATGLTHAELAPGRAEVAGAGLRWSALQWQAPRLANEHPSVLAEMELEPLAVAPLLARWQPDFGWGGNLVVGGQIKVRTLPQLDMDIVLERSSGDLTVTEERGAQSLGLTDLRLALTAHNGLWQLAQGLAGTNLGSLGGAITVHANPQAMWPQRGAPLEGVLQANVSNLGTWGGWVPAGWRLGGTVNASLQLAGVLGAPALTGQANGRQVSVRNPLQGIDLTEGQFDLKLNGETATLNQFSARGGAGQVTAQGRLTLGEQPKARVELKADKFVLLHRVDRRLQASGNALLELGPQLLQLDGQFTIDEGLFDFSRGDAPSLDDDVYVIRPEQARAEAAINAKASERKTRVNLAIDLGQRLKVRGYGLDSRLRGELKLNQTEKGMSLTGGVRAVNGTYAAYGQKLEVETGELTFVGPYDNPRLNVLAVRPNTDIRVGVKVTGTALSPRIALYSDPDMADTDKLSWLLLGRAPDNLGRADTALLQRAAMALISGDGESTSGKLLKNIGLDELSVSQGEDETRGAIVHLGKQLTRRWYVGYERGLNETTGSWQLIYRLAQRFTIRAQTGEDNALDVIWQWKWE